MGYSLAETDDEDPERLAVTQRMTWAYLWSALHDDDRKGDSTKGWHMTSAEAHELAATILGAAADLADQDHTDTPSATPDQPAPATPTHIAA